VWFSAFAAKNHAVSRLRGAMRAFSFGGGVQSTAALVLAAQGKIDYRIFLFCNVGADSENPDTLTYVRDYSIPYAAQHGLEFHKIARTTNNGETLYQKLIKSGKSIPIPTWMAGTGPSKRECTHDYKRIVVRRWLGKGNHIVGLGISLDEFHRMHSSSGFSNIEHEYPLIDLRLTRSDCIKIINDAGLPLPPKSSCWFCPFNKLQYWQELKRTKPELFVKAVEIETIINNRRRSIGRPEVFLTSRAKPLSIIIADQPLLFDYDGSCESGYCMV
jgi:hypothetical protein